MTEETQVQSDQSTQSSGEQEQTGNNATGNRSAEELAIRLKEVALEAKTYRQKNAELKKQLEETAKVKLQEQGQFKELADIWQRKATESESQSQKIKQAFVIKTISDSIALEASKLGCVDTDAIVSLLQMDQVPIDENFNVDKNSVKAMLEDFRKSKPYFFQKPAPAIATAVPSKPEQPGNDLSKLTLHEKAALLSMLKNQGK